MTQELPDIIVRDAYSRLVKGEGEPGDGPLIVLGALRGDVAHLHDELKTFIERTSTGGNSNGTGLRDRARRSAPPVLAGGGFAAIVFEIARIVAGG